MPLHAVQISQQPHVVDRRVILHSPSLRKQTPVDASHWSFIPTLYTVFIRFSALGAYLIFEPSGWALIWGGCLFEVGRLLNFQHFSRNSEKNSNILIDFSDNEIIDCEPLKKYRNNQYPFCFCTLYLPYLCFGGWEGGVAYSRFSAQNYFIGGWGGRLFEAGRLLTFPS